MGWSRHAPHGLTFAQAAAAQREHEHLAKGHPDNCDCDACCWEASQRAIASAKRSK